MDTKNMAEKTDRSQGNIFVLLIEHDSELRKIMKLSLEQAGIQVLAVERFANALTVLQQQQPDLFLVDFELRGGNPGKLIKVYRKHLEDKTGIVLVSTSERIENGWRQTHKPDSVIYKPFDVRYLVRMIKSLTQKNSILTST